MKYFSLGSGLSPSEVFSTRALAMGKPDVVAEICGLADGQDGTAGLHKRFELRNGFCDGHRSDVTTIFLGKVVRELGRILWDLPWEWRRGRRKR